MTYHKSDIITNLSLRVMDMVESQEYDLRDMLAMAATYIVQYDFNESVADDPNRLFRTVNRLRSRIRITNRTYEELKNAFRDNWVDNLEDESVSSYLLDLNIIEKIENDRVVLKEKIVNAYKGIREKKSYKEMVFRVSTVARTKGVDSLDRVVKGTPLEKHRLWSWKCNSERTENGLPPELCCVGSTVMQFVDVNLKEVESLDWLAQKVGDTGKFGTVSRSWWHFGKEIKHGDYVLMRNYQTDRIEGIGRFVGDMIYDDSKPYYRNVRKVMWIVKEPFESPTHIAGGNTWPMPIEDPDVVRPLMDKIKFAVSECNMENLLGDYIGWYKENWEKLCRLENYKWEAIECFQNNFSIAAEEFLEMLKAALDKTGNLLASSSSFFQPRNVMLRIAQLYPEELHMILVKLYDESRELKDRVEQFEAGYENLFARCKAEGAFQMEKQESNANVYTLSVLLALRHPDKYYFYKPSTYTEFAKETQLNVKVSGSMYEKLSTYFGICNRIKEVLTEDDELMELYKSTYDKDLSDCNLLVQDFIFSIGWHFLNQSEDFQEADK